MTGPGRGILRAAGMAGAAGLLAAAAMLAAASPASAATSVASQPAAVGGGCTSAPPPQSPTSGVSYEIAGHPRTLPPASGSNVSNTAWFLPSQSGAPTEWERFGFAGLTWHSFGLENNLGGTSFLGEMFTVLIGGPAPNVCTVSSASVMANLITTGANIEFGVAKAMVACDIALHNWASGTGWIARLGPTVTTATRDVRNALFTPFAGISLGLLALVLLIQANRGELASAVTQVAWAIMILGLVAGVTAYPTWAAEQASTLLASTINSMDAGFVKVHQEAAAADAHSSLLVSDVLFQQWLYGEFGSSSTAIARQEGPKLLEAQALSWNQVATPSAAANWTGIDKKQWNSVVSNVSNQDSAILPQMEGANASRLGYGALAVVEAVIVCGFDYVASIVIIVAMALFMVTVILLPALAVIGLHHKLRFAVTRVLSLVGGWLFSAVMFSAAAGVNIQISSLLLSPGNKIFANGTASVFAGIVGELVFTIALFAVVQRVRHGNHGRLGTAVRDQTLRSAVAHYAERILPF